jgi:hypothetical protein
MEGGHAFHALFIVQIKRTSMLHANASAACSTEENLLSANQSALAGHARAH